MPPIKPVKNQYCGINAHLHSLWQARGGWDEFHFDHITHLSTDLRRWLRPMGYTVGSQNSLQIRRAEEPARRPEADVTIYDPDPVRGQQPVTATPITATLNAPQVVNLLEMLEVYEEISPYRAVVIYDRPNRGVPVAWIELLSPSNKPGGQDADLYRRKRQDILQSGIVFVELDYLHESAPTFDKLPVYHAGRHRGPAQSGSSPYNIIVIDPRPSFDRGKFYRYPIFVDEPFPPVAIPLSSSDVLQYDFGLPYQRTFEETFCGDSVDYTQLPLNFDRYSDTDKARILSRMLHVIRRAQAGQSLEQPLQPIETLSLEDALKQFEVLSAEN